MRVRTDKGAGQDDGGGALTMNGPNAMRLFLVAAPAAISTAPAAAVSTKGATSPAANARAPSQPRNMPSTPDSFTSPQPRPGGYRQASTR